MRIKVLLVFERVGQVLCTGFILLFTDYAPTTLEPWITWFIASVALMVLYEVFWLRYFKSEKTVSDFYCPLFGIPAPGAALPMVAFLLLGIYGKVIWLIISAVILGIRTYCDTFAAYKRFERRAIKKALLYNAKIGRIKNVAVCSDKF